MQHAGLIYKLRQYEFPDSLVKIIDQFLTDRKFHVHVEGNNSTLRPIPYGVPQGAVCSPVLYNLFTADAPSPQPCLRGLFADDTCYFISSRQRGSITCGLRQTLISNMNFFNHWKININIDKTQAMFFTRRLTREIPRRPLHISNNNNIIWSTENVKYLGVLLDKRLTFKNHINYVIDKTNKAIHTLYPLLASNSKLNINNKLLLYKTAIRPIITYASPVSFNCAAIHLKKLQVLQNKTLKLIYDLPHYTRTTTLHETADLQLITTYIRELADRFNNNVNIE